MAPKRSMDRKRQTKIDFSATPKPIRKKAARALSLSDDDSPAPASKRQKIEKTHGMFGSSDVDMASPDSSETESESEDEIQVISVKRKRGAVPKPSDNKEEARTRSSKRKQKQAKTVELSDDEDEEEEEEEMQTRRKGRRSGRRASTPDEEDVQPRRKGRRSAKRASTREEDSDEDSEHNDGDRSGDEDDELKEDLEFLRSSPLPDRGRLRSTQDKPMNERQKALEALKKRRGGTQEPSSSATPSRARRVIIESDSDLEVIQEEQEDSESSVSDAQVESEDEEEEQTNAYDMFQEDDYDEDFVVDDADDPIGAPAESQALPLQFSSLSSAKPRELFKYAVEWMVKKKINPAFPANDEVYNLTFRKLEDEVKGLANSKFSSSAWTPDFSRAIRARPDMVSNEISQGRKEVLGQHCEACNRKNHPASWEVVFVGNPYNKDTLEPVGDESDSSGGSSSDSDSDSSLSADSETELNGEKPTFNAAGERIPPESKQFTLGSTCQANAQVAHTLLHWRYHLNTWVVDYLVREGHCAPEELVKRDKWTVKKRDKLARKILKKMERVGEVKKLHHLYKEQVKYAVDVNNDYNRGWGRRR